MNSTNKLINGIATHIIDWNIENPKAAILIVHGYAEHAGRYDHVAKFFNENKIAVRSFDLRGHGLSKGERANVDNFEYFIDDLATITQSFRSDYDNVPLFVLGHSMGGLILSIAAAKNKIANIENIILSNPAFDISSNQPKILVAIIRFLAKILPNIQTVKLDSKFISRDKEVRDKYDHDPLVYRGGSKPKMINEFDNAGKWIRENASQIKQNLYLNYSKSDKVVYPFASEDFFKNISSSDKKLTEYPGLYHELLNEPEKLEVMNNVLDWINSKM